MLLPDSEKSLRIRLAVSTEYRPVTDRQIDRRTSCDGIVRLSVVKSSRCAQHQYVRVETITVSHSDTKWQVGTRAIDWADRCRHAASGSRDAKNVPRHKHNLPVHRRHCAFRRFGRIDGAIPPRRKFENEEFVFLMALTCTRVIGALWHLPKSAPHINSLTYLLTYLLTCMTLSDWA